jgi:hypothetical protein
MLADLRPAALKLLCEFVLSYDVLTAHSGEQTVHPPVFNAPVSSQETGRIEFYTLTKMNLSLYG